MNKIAPDHLARSAFVYVRQSTPDQLINNPESRRRQYALATRARTLGWENVVVIRSPAQATGRPIRCASSNRWSLLTAARTARRIRSAPFAKAPGTFPAAVGAWGPNRMAGEELRVKPDALI
jgi:hypothetical protein